MGIQTSSVNIDGTVSTSGGTATGMIAKGNTLNEIQVILDDSSEFVEQTKIDFQVKEPVVKPSAPNGYTQARNTVRIYVPLALDNGNVTVNTLELKLSCDHETTEAEVQSLLVLGAQLLSDSDYSDFWKKQSLS